MYIEMYIKWLTNTDTKSLVGSATGFNGECLFRAQFSLPPQSLREQRDGISQQEGTDNALEPAARQANLISSASRFRSVAKAGPASSPRQSFNCSTAFCWNLRGTKVAFKGQIQRYPVACSLMDYFSPVPLFSLLQAMMALELTFTPAHG